ncbi:membrane hypothetical protein [Candidatus Sulfotelmatomonas gaucii]|uniref:Uncharacterized protein n=1 Tax=Candidatus Sulfuritelmatomonas gaucii TaxID=2043161 RepID=A0A2N9L431_9BACT|nr:membrane hypothetical protein [Candidatus Sulfotelmatomonas gaucii]
MWALGLLFFYLFYRVAIVYYLGMYFKPSLKRPMGSIYRWFHPTVITVSVVLFLASVFFFFLTNPWLVIVPFPLTAIFLYAFVDRVNRQRQQMLEKAVEIQVTMEREGRPQSEIDKAVYLGVTGEVYPLETDCAEPGLSELKSFMLYCVLSRTMGFDAHEELSEKIRREGMGKHYVSESDKIEAAIDALYAKKVKEHEAYESFRKARS